MNKPVIKKTFIEKINSAVDANLVLWDADGHQRRIDLEDLQAMAIGLDVCRTYHTQLSARVKELEAEVAKWERWASTHEKKLSKAAQKDGTT
jgi:hypothetical protein